MNSSAVINQTGRHGHRIGKIAAFFTALITVVMMTFGAMPNAFAAGGDVVAQGVTASITLDGETWDGTDVVREGDKLKMVVQYGQETIPGSEVIFELSSNAVFDASLPNNEAIASIEKVDANKIKVKFVDNLGDINQGIFELDFEMLVDENGANQELTWKIGDEESTLEIIVVEEAHTFGPTTQKVTKKVSHEQAADFEVNEEGTVTVTNKQQLLEQVSTFTVTASVGEAGQIKLTDVMPEELALITDSFQAMLTEWDSNGTNKVKDAEEVTFTTTTVDATGFTGSVNVDGPATLVLTYQAQLTEAGLDNVIAQLESEIDELGAEKGTASYTIKNEVQLKDEEKASASIKFQVKKDGTDIGNAFGKSFKGDQTVLGDEQGHPLETVYASVTLSADLRKFAPTAPTQNVIINDTLPTGVGWDTSDAPFLTSTSDELVLTESANCVEADFASNTSPGSWCVSGQTLLINVGVDNTKRYTFKAKAKVTDLTEFAADAVEIEPEGTKVYTLKNTAIFTYGDDESQSKSSEIEVTVLPPYGDDGLNDESAFYKVGHVEDTQVQPGETTWVEYFFELQAGVPNVDVTQSSIIDYIDSEKFQLPTDANDIDIIGGYNGKPLGPEHFDVSYDADGNIVIKLSAEGITLANAEGLGHTWWVSILIETIPFEGKETFTLTNKATLQGSSGENLYWSSTESESTSFGNEAEVRKRVFDTHAEAGKNPWVEEVEALVGENGLFENPFIYRIEFIPHGSYNNVVITDVVDELPEGVEFLGFITENNLDATELEDVAIPGPIDLGGNLEATYHNDEDKVVISQQEDTKLNTSDNPRPTAYVLVNVTETEDEVVNAIGGTSAKIKPVTASVSWSKVNGEGDLLAGSEWLLEGPAGYSQIITDNGALDENSLDGKFTVSKLNYGSYTLKEITAPEGHLISSEAITFPIERGFTTLDLGSFINKSKTYAIGDVTWIDSNKNGLQDDDEEPLVGVTVELLQDGEVIASTVTDSDGRYLFDELDAGTYQVKFILTEEQAAVYRFTQQDAGDDALDSDADPVTGLTIEIVLNGDNAALTQDYTDQEFNATEGIDPTWDAGVVLIDIDVEEPAVEEGEDPEDAVKPADKPADKPGVLENTGGAAPIVGLVAGALMLLAGATIFVRGRRQQV